MCCIVFSIYPPDLQESDGGAIHREAITFKFQRSCAGSKQSPNYFIFSQAYFAALEQNYRFGTKLFKTLILKDHPNVVHTKTIIQFKIIKNFLLTYAVHDKYADDELKYIL